MTLLSPILSNQNSMRPWLCEGARQMIMSLRKIPWSESACAGVEFPKAPRSRDFEHLCPTQQSPDALRDAAFSVSLIDALNKLDFCIGLETLTMLLNFTDN